MEIACEYHLVRDREALMGKLTAYGFSLYPGSTVDNSSFRHMRWDSDIIDAKHASPLPGGLPPVLSEFKSRRRFLKALKKQASNYSGTDALDMLLRALTQDHCRTLSLPASVGLHLSRARTACHTLTRLCSHPDSPPEAAIVLAHARMVEARATDRMWDLGDLPGNGAKQADLSIMIQLLDELEAQTQEAVRVCARQGSVMLSGVASDEALLACLQKDSILLRELA